MLPTRRRCPYNSGLWMLCCKGMCAPWDTRRRDGTCFSMPYIFSTRAIGAPFPRSSGGKYINSRRECTTELLSPQEPGDYHSHFSSLTYFERRALKTIWQTGPSLSIHGSTKSSGIRAIPTCPELKQSQSLWTCMI
jgi:hypothetical protein